ncbi:hypothetical protein ACFUIZ_34645 [Streptomyces cinereoruber]|uniref:hypothetical protein n=1 Tax=Streptomyces cinereoruber TaxID=67260 RepID=UPI00362F0577
MTSVNGTAGTPEGPGHDRLRWATILTACASMAAVVTLSLMHLPEAATAVGTIGTTTVTIAGMQMSRSKRS